jgi:cytochrome-b5 reductase
MATKSIFSSRLPTVLGGVALAGVSVGIYSRYMMNVAHADSGAPPKAFGSGPAFLSLKLESSEAVNHNTKKLRFALPTEAHVSGLTLTCEIPVEGRIKEGNTC